MLRGAIFDMDGTLLDSMYVWRDFDREYLKRKGVELREDLRAKIAPLTLPQAAELFQRDYGVKDDIDTIVNEVNSMVEQEYFYKVPAKEGIPEMLEEFYRAGVKMCVATATDRYLVEAALSRVGIAKYFGRIFTSTEIGSSKREPKTFEIALEYLGTPKEETYIFEDSCYAVQAAKKFGYNVVAVRDRHSEKYEKEIIAAADIYLETIPQWRKWLTLPQL